jgi:TRAP-type C4-dicarboxylate transport system permease small subunit
MRDLFETIYRIYGKFLTGLAVLAAFGFFGIMWLIDANALSRKIFNAPITGTLEITEALMVFAILLPMGYTQMRRGHIRVTLITGHFPPRLGKYFFVFSLLVGCIFAAWATYASFNFFMRSYNINEHAWGSIRIPIYPAKGAVALGMFLLSIQFLLDAIRVGVFDIEDEEFSDLGDDSDQEKEAL